MADIHKIDGIHLPVLHRSDRMASVFLKPPIVAYRRGKNLDDTLVHGNTNKALKQKGSTFSCREYNAMQEIKYGVLPNMSNIRQLGLRVAAIGMLSMHPSAAIVARPCLWVKLRGC